MNPFAGRKVLVYLNTDYLSESFLTPGFTEGIRNVIYEKFKGVPIEIVNEKPLLQGTFIEAFIHNSKEIDALPQFGGPIVEDLGYSWPWTKQLEVNVMDHINAQSGCNYSELIEAIGTTTSHEIGHQLLPLDIHDTVPADSLMAGGSQELFGESIQFTQENITAMNNYIQNPEIYSELYHPDENGISILESILSGINLNPDVFSENYASNLSIPFLENSNLWGSFDPSQIELTESIGGFDGIDGIGDIDLSAIGAGVASLFEGLGSSNELDIGNILEAFPERLYSAENVDFSSWIEVVSDLGESALEFLGEILSNLR